MIGSVDYLASILANDKSRSWEIGPLGHGLHALKLYEERVFQPADNASPSRPLAGHGPVLSQPKGAAKSGPSTTRR
jgi:hypothetical protein